MVDESTLGGAAAAMYQINEAWLDGEVEGLARMVHPEIVMVLPGFIGRVKGRDEFLAGFRDFCQNAKIQEFRRLDDQLDVAGDTAVATFRYEMLYERSGKHYRSTGRDLWVLERQRGEWIAVWRTMLDIERTTLDQVRHQLWSPPVRISQFDTYVRAA